MNLQLKMLPNFKTKTTSYSLAEGLEAGRSGEINRELGLFAFNIVSDHREISFGAVIWPSAFDSARSELHFKALLVRFG